MKESQYWLAGTAAFATLLVAWFAGRWLRLSGSDLWVMRLGVTALGLSAIGALLWPRLKEAQTKSKPPGSAAGEVRGNSGASQVGSGDIASLMHEAEASSGKKMADLPVIVVLDATSSSNSDLKEDGSLVKNSGLNAESLASISGAKVWIAEGTFFLELQPTVYSDGKAMGELIHSLQPGRLRSLFSKAAAPSRTIVLSLSSKGLTRPEKAGEAKTRAQDLRGKLRDMSRALGIRLPFYVVFTGLEEVSHFREYVTRLPTEMIADPFGVALRDESLEAGVWAEQQTKRNATGFRQLFEILSAHRLELLTQESSYELRRGVYLFPREFRELTRSESLREFLLEVARPHQLGSSPYLRGFFFTGAMEVPGVRRGSERTGEDSSQDLAEDLNLSRVLTGGAFGGSFVSRPQPKQKQWIFLDRLFSAVILPDISGLKNTFVSRRVSMGRRVLLAGLSGIAVLWAFATLISFAGNRDLQKQATELSRSLQIAAGSVQQRTSDAQLNHLESLRQLLVTLRTYGKEGHPWRLGMGLYTGNELLPQVRRAYFDRFEPLMLKPARDTLAQELSSLGSNAGMNSFESSYASLKAYLIIQSHPDKSVREFLSPILLRSWQTQEGSERGRGELARDQFDFYSNELRVNPPYQPRADDAAVSAGRHYIHDNFGGADQVYSLMKASASQQNAAIDFSGSDVIVGTPKIPGAFTKAGWTAMQGMLRAPGNWSTEPWVVEMPEESAAKVANELPGRYTADYIGAWGDFLGKSKVVACRSRGVSDTAKRITLLSEATESPLLKLFCVASQNTDVDSPQVKDAFEPVQTFVSPQCEKQYTGENGAYIRALFDLKERLQDPSLAGQGGDTRSAIAPQLTAARSAIHDLEGKFHRDEQQGIAQTVVRLLTEPVIGAETCAPGLELGSVCGPFNTNLKGKYPFNLKATAQASVADVNAFFNPKSGTLAGLLQQTLKNVVVEQGGQYVSNPAASRPARADFLASLNRLARFQEALFPKGAQDMQIPLSVRLTPSAVIASVTLQIGDHSQTFAGGKSEEKNYLWNLSPQGAEMRVLLPGGLLLTDLKMPGAWGLLRLLDNMKLISQKSNQVSFELGLRERSSGGEVQDKNGTPAKIKADISGDSVWLLRRDGRAALQCVTNVTQ